MKLCGCPAWARGSAPGTRHGTRAFPGAVKLWRQGMAKFPTAALRSRPIWELGREGALHGAGPPWRPRRGRSPTWRAAPAPLGAGFGQPEVPPLLPQRAAGTAWAPAPGCHHSVGHDGALEALRRGFGPSLRHDAPHQVGCAPRHRVDGQRSSAGLARFQSAWIGIRWRDTGGGLWSDTLGDAARRLGRGHQHRVDGHVLGAGHHRHSKPNEAEGPLLVLAGRWCPPVARRAGRHLPLEGGLHLLLRRLAGRLQGPPSALAAAEPGSGRTGPGLVDASGDEGANRQDLGARKLRGVARLCLGGGQATVNLTDGAVCTNELLGSGGCPWGWADVAWAGCWNWAALGMVAGRSSRVCMP